MKAKVRDVEVEGTPEELAAFVKALETVQLAPLPISIPSIWTAPVDVCPLGGAHQYPTVWIGLNPPPCEKYGQAAYTVPQWTVTFEQLGMDLPTTTTSVQTNEGMQLHQIRGEVTFSPWFERAEGLPKYPGYSD